MNLNRPWATNVKPSPRGNIWLTYFFVGIAMYFKVLVVCPLSITAYSRKTRKTTEIWRKWLFFLIYSTFIQIFSKRWYLFITNMLCRSSICYSLRFQVIVSYQLQHIPGKPRKYGKKILFFYSFPFHSNF